MKSIVGLMTYSGVKEAVKKLKKNKIPVAWSEGIPRYTEEMIFDRICELTVGNDISASIEILIHCRPGGPFP